MCYDNGGQAYIYIVSNGEKRCKAQEEIRRECGGAGRNRPLVPVERAHAILPSRTKGAYLFPRNFTNRD